MPRKTKQPRAPDTTAPLLEVDPQQRPTPEYTIREVKGRVWTDHKAHLIEHYLRYFILVTKHGTYIDGFAGPQYRDRPEMWAARLVLKSQPRWMRQFFLFDKNRRKFALLEKLKADQAPRKRGEPKRHIVTEKGDSNTLITQLLSQSMIRGKEATFCLLDPHTFECKWSTVQAIANYPKGQWKIEIFYFLPQAWLNRALAAQKNTSVIRDWWGRDDWQALRTMTTFERAEALCERFRKELKYISAKPWPIYKRKDGGPVMYHMIHATDHPAAPPLMVRAYERATGRKEPLSQVEMFFMRPADLSP